MNSNFSENLKKIRKDNNLSQEQLAEMLNVSRQAISKWESKTAYPEMDKILFLCDKFNLNIDDLLHKDIKEIKGEEETKKKINNYIDDFLNFVTNTINLFSNMSFKSKIKCLFEQTIICIILFLIFYIVGMISYNLLYGIFDFLPGRVFYTLYSIIKLIYVIFSFVISIIVLTHIFKTRYLDYYEKIKSDVVKEENNKDENNNKNKILFKRNENKIIIRDPKHSEYGFIKILFKFIVGIIKFFVLLFSIFIFILLVCCSSLFVLSFLVIKTGFFFIGLVILFLALIVILIDIILLILNFAFNRKNDKKRIIWSFIISLILVGVGSSFIVIGSLSFNYNDYDESNIKTEYIEIDMKDNLNIDYHNIEYIESSNNNIKIEYQISKYCDINYSYFNSNSIHFWANYKNPFNVSKELIKDLNNKKIYSLDCDFKIDKIYTNKENINKLKSNLE